jgi:hypothetical protein
MMIASRVSRVAAAFVLVTMAVLSACSSGTGPGAPFLPQISNAPDDFQFQATNVRNATWTFTYLWSNSSNRASVTQTSTVTAGTATLNILDAGRTQVYANDLRANGTFISSAGVTGRWTIKIEFTNYSGSPNIRVQKS